MPYTEKQVRFLESSGSPLTAEQKAKMNAELHADPSLGHHKKGSAAMKRVAKAEPMREMRVEIHRGPGPKKEVTGFTVHHHMVPKPASKSGAFMEDTTHQQPFSKDEHGKMMAHVTQHLKAQLGMAGADHTEPDGDEGEEEAEE